MKEKESQRENPKAKKKRCHGVHRRTKKKKNPIEQKKKKMIKLETLSSNCSIRC